MTSDEHLHEQAEAAVVDACATLDKISDTHLVFMRLPNGQYARKITGPNYTSTVVMMADVSNHLLSFVISLAELTAAKADKTGEKP